MSTATVFTPEEVAERWKCSPSHVRRLVASQKLAGFRLGGKLLRIPLAAVEAFECEPTPCSDTEVAGRSPPTKTDVESRGISFLRLEQRKRRDNSTGS